MDSEIMDEIGLTYEVFKAASSAWAPFATPEYEESNLMALVSWGNDNLPGGSTAFKDQGAYEISFNACRAAGTLSPDPSWKSWATRKAELQREHNTLTGAESKARYFSGDAEYKRFVDEEIK